MPPAGTCTVCAHPSRLQIDQDLARGLQPAAAARQWTLSQAAIRRHVGSRHVELPAPPAGANENGEVIDIPPDGTPRERLQVLIRALEERVTSGRARTDDFRELRIAYKDLDQMSGGAAPTEVSIDQVAGWREFLADFWKTMRKYPEAGRAFAELAKKHRLGELRGRPDNPEARSGAPITSGGDGAGRASAHNASPSAEERRKAREAKREENRRRHAEEQLRRAREAAGETAA